MSASREPILLVDDDSDYSDLVKIRLETSGYQVACVPNGSEALKLLETDYRPRLIIMDLEMPDKNGLTTLINLNIKQSNDQKKGAAPIPVIVATGLQGDLIRDLIMQQKVAGYLKKPYSAEELIEKVRSLTRG